MSPVQPNNPASQADYYTDLPVGEILRRTRAHYNQTLDDASSYLRIRASQLEALEKNDLAQLPGQVYAIGYIRTYSEYLGLDGEKMVHLFKQQSGGKNAKPELHFPVPASESKAPNLYIIFGSLAVLALVIGVWIALSAVGKAREKSVAEIPSVPADMRTSEVPSPPPSTPVATPQLNDAAVKAAAVPGVATATTATVNPTGPVTQTATPGVTAPTPAPVAQAAPAAAVATQQTPAPVTTATAAAAPLATAQNAAPATTALSAGTAPAAAVQKKEIVITIKERSWVEVRDKEGKPILSRILKPGEVFIVPEANYGLRLDTGNAAGLELTVNGQPYPPLGKEGDILRGFSLDGNKMLEKLPSSATAQ